MLSDASNDDDDDDEAADDEASDDDPVSDVLDAFGTTPPPFDCGTGLIGPFV